MDNSPKKRSGSGEGFYAKVLGHVKITDDLGNVLLDKHNAIHPQNMARVFARALSNESHYQIHRIALGNGGTTVSAGNTVTYKTPNDGQLPDPAGWQSRLYNETYSEIVDDRNPNLGEGTGTVKDSDPASIADISGPGVRSSEEGLNSFVVIDVTLNADEPSSQAGSDNTQATQEFYFDELGLYTSGRRHVNTSGTQTILLQNKDITANTGLAVSSQYSFNISVNGSSPQSVVITTPNEGTGSFGGSTYVSYGDILPLINAGLSSLGVVASITDKDNEINTGGNLVLTTTRTGPTASVIVTDTQPYPTNWLFDHLLGYNGLDTPVQGELAGVQNNAADPDTIRERLLTHIIFSPILKSANRTIRILYTLTVAIARTQEPNV